MFCLNDSTRFLLYPYPTDMRKSFYSLSGIVTNHMGKNVQDGDAYIFINKNLTGMYNPQIEMFARFKMKSSFHKTKRII